MLALTDESLTQKVAQDHRTLGRIAWHIVQTIPEMAGRTGLKISGPGDKDPVPTTADAIKRAYDTVAKSLHEQVAATWKDETLQLQDDMYGQMWPRGLSLRAVINHEVHHRGQMTVLMRQAGLKVPGVYGPSLDEWGQYGMKPPEI
jgi:uncharacterized damage-inducible protein DinB